MKTVYIPKYFNRTSQVGHGIGGIFRSLTKLFTPMAKSALRASKPFMKKAAKFAGRQALQVGLDTVKDISQGDNVKASLSKNVKRGRKRTLKKVKDTLSNGSIELMKKALKGIDGVKDNQTGKRSFKRKVAKRKKTIFD